MALQFWQIGISDVQQACQMQRPINLEHQGSHVVGLLLLLIGIIICISYFCIFVIVIVFGIFVISDAASY